MGYFEWSWGDNQYFPVGIIELDIRDDLNWDLMSTFRLNDPISDGRSLSNQLVDLCFGLSGDLVVFEMVLIIVFNEDGFVGSAESVGIVLGKLKHSVFLLAH